MGICKPWGKEKDMLDLSPNGIDTCLLAEQVKPSIIDLLGGIVQLLLIPLRVAGCRLNVLVAENLGQTDNVVPVVFEELLRKRVAEEMGMKPHADQG